MANPSVTHQEVSYSFNRYVATAGEKPNNWNLGAAPESSALKHKSGISLDWTLEEQAILFHGSSNNGRERTWEKAVNSLVVVGSSNGNKF